MARLHDIARRSPTKGQIGLLLTELDTHSHRASAVLGGAFVEDALESAIQSRFVTMGKGTLRTLFEYPGPLSSFDAKIQIGHAIGLFGPILRHDLNVIRRIRNVFAHAKVPISFDTPEVVEEMKRSQYLRWKDQTQQSQIMDSIVHSTPVEDSLYRYWYSVLTKLMAEELFALGRNLVIRLAVVSNLP